MRQFIFGCLPEVGLEHKGRKSVRLKSVACQRAFVQQVQNPLGLKWILIIFKMVYVPLILQPLFLEPWYEYHIKCSVTAGTDAISA